MTLQPNFDCYYQMVYLKGGPSEVATQALLTGINGVGGGGEGGGRNKEEKYAQQFFTEFMVHFVKSQHLIVMQTRPWAFCVGSVCQ